jgi:uncharacterized repeat protein (TIGR02543 family)
MRISARKIAVFLLITCIAVTSLSFAPIVSAYYYPLSQCSLSTSVNYSGAGYVTPSGQNILYYYGESVTLRAYTYIGYVFDGWYLNGVYQGKLSTITLSMTQDYTLYATFSQRTAILTVTTNPIDGGTTTPGAGIWNYSAGSTASVKAYPASGNTFSGWYLDGTYQGLGTTITVTMDTDHQLSAFFSGNGSNPTPEPTATPAPTLAPTPGLPVPSLSFYCASSTASSGFNVALSGALSINSSGISGTGIVLSYSATGGATWHDLAYVITDDYGSFSAVWMPSASGNYVVKASWYSDGVYSSVSSTVNFAVAPNPAENQVFSVSSNSTVSSLVFDSTASQLKFTVSGDSGTTGYVQVCVPKNLLPVPGDLRVSLDGQDVSYQVFSQGDAWIVTTEYHHSTHSVVMALSSSTALPTNDDAVTNPTSGSSSSSPLEVSPLVTLPIIVVLLGLVIFLLLRRRPKAATNQSSPL